MVYIYQIKDLKNYNFQNNQLNCHMTVFHFTADILLKMYLYFDHLKKILLLEMISILDRGYDCPM